MSTTEEFVRYRAIRNNAMFYFKGYSDITGRTVYTADGKHANGEDKMKTYSFSDGVVVQIHNSQKDEIDFLDNSPYCKGSKLNEMRREKPYYVKIDPEADAEKELVVAQLSADAMVRAVAICNDKELCAMVAMLCGGGSKDAAQQKLAIMGYATKAPEKFLSLTKKENFAHMEYEVFIKEATGAGTLQKRGDIYYFFDDAIGTSVNDVVKTFIDKPELFKAIQMAHNELVSGPSAAPKKAQAGGEK